MIHTGYARDSRRWTESKLYFAVVWTMVIFGCLILLSGFDQPLVLLTINRKYLPQPIQLAGYRRVILFASVALLGTCTAIVAANEASKLV